MSSSPNSISKGFEDVLQLDSTLKDASNIGNDFQDVIGKETQPKIIKKDAKYWEKENVQIQYEEDDPIEDALESNVMVKNNRKMPDFKIGNSKFAKYGAHQNGAEDHKKIQIEIKMKSNEFLENQSKQRINGIDVYFPFKPYDCQNNFMEKVIEALKNSDNALLESPTGTGKTLSLLCSALSWLKTEREKMVGDLSVELPRIIYTSRTHSQLSQCQKELSNTVYKPRTVLIASRDHLCVNSAVNMNRGFALNAACRGLQKAINPCLYFKNRDQSQKTLSWEPMDIEELHKQAK